MKRNLWMIIQLSQIMHAYITVEPDMKCKASGHKAMYA